ncbi:MAG: putative Ig domain-containing protein, partial [Patescibacteria group bacterium]
MKRIFAIFFSLTLVVSPLYALGEKISDLGSSDATIISTGTEGSVSEESESSVVVEEVVESESSESDYRGESKNSYTLPDAGDDASENSAVMMTAFSSLVTNQLPVFAGPVTAFAVTGNPVSFFITVNDPDGDLVEVTSDLPSGASYDGIIGKFTWTPTAQGSYPIHFFGFDGTGTSTYNVLVTVLKDPLVNQLPSWVGPTSAITIVGSPVSFFET